MMKTYKCFGQSGCRSSGANLKRILFCCAPISSLTVTTSVSIESKVRSPIASFLASSTTKKGFRSFNTPSVEKFAFN